MLATPINQVKLNVRPKSADVSLTAASHGCVDESQTQENEKSYSLVYKQSECPPPVPEKSTELQQYLTVKITAGTEVPQDQQQECGEQSSENLDDESHAESSQ
jgi:hypothetical protein